MTNVSVLDVAKYVLSKYDVPLTAMKLQKLCYYSQAWTLVWSGQPLFKEQTEAWANGPVVRELFNRHRGRYALRDSELGAGDPQKLTPTQRGYVDAVVKAYGPMSASQLSLLTHSEQPWKDARGAAADGARSDAPIDLSVMRDFYTWLAQSPDAVHSAEEVNFPSWA